MRLVLTCVLCAFLVACGQVGDNGSIQLKSSGPAVETVNGEAVPVLLLDAIARGRDLDLNKAEQRRQALDELTQYVLLAQEAKREKFADITQFQADVEIARLQGIANATLAQIQLLSPITDAMLKAQYDQEIAKAGKVTYDFGQLLFDKEDDALKAAGEAMGGMPFIKLFDAWQGKAKQAKIYTQVRANQLPEGLVKALQELHIGETNKVPVKTEFGWHVINLTATTPFVAPDFNQVKEGVRRSMQARITDERIEKLKANAQISLADGNGASKSEPESLQPQKN